MRLHNTVGTLIVYRICQLVLPVSVLTGVRHHSPVLRLCIVKMLLLVPVGSYEVQVSVG